MRITVERTMGESYLLLEEEDREGPKDFVEIQMLTENCIDGLLRLQVRRENGLTKYRYLTSGMASVRQLYEKKEMDAEALRNLIGGIRKALISAEEYLLCPEHILTDPSYVFQDLTSKAVFLCLCPLWKEPLQTGMQKLAEFLISVTNHDADAAIDLSYGFYKLVFAGDYSFDRLLEQEEKKETKREEVRFGERSTGDGKEREEKQRKNSSNGALSVLGFAAIFALIAARKLRYASMSSGSGRPPSDGTILPITGTARLFGCTTT